MTLTLLESRLPVAISLPLLAFVVGNEREEWRAPVVALPLAFGAAKQPDQVVMHRAVIGTEPVEGFAGGLACRRGSFESWRSPANEVAAPRKLFLIPLRACRGLQVAKS